MTVLTRGEPGERGGVRFEHWDPSLPIATPWSEPYEAVVNLAGEQAVGKRYTARVKDGILKSRVQSTDWLVNAMGRTEHPPLVFVCASGVGFYGSSLSDARCDESAPAGSDFLALVCVAWEAAAQRAEALGVRVVRARISAVLSEQGGALEQMVRPFKLFAGGPIGTGRQGFSWIHLHDQVSALLACMDGESLAGPVNLCSPEPVSNAEVSRQLGQLLGRPASLKAPAFALKALFGEGAEPLLLGQWAVPRALLAAGFQFRYPTLHAALSAALGVPSSAVAGAGQGS